MGNAAYASHRSRHVRCDPPSKPQWHPLDRSHFRSLDAYEDPSAVGIDFPWPDPAQFQRTPMTLEQLQELVARVFAEIAERSRPAADAADAIAPRYKRVCDPARLGGRVRRLSVASLVALVHGGLPTPAQLAAWSPLLLGVGLSELADRGLAQLSPAKPGAHGHPDFYVAFTEAGREAVQAASCKKLSDSERDRARGLPRDLAALLRLLEKGLRGAGARSGGAVAKCRFSALAPLVCEMDREYAYAARAEAARHKSLKRAVESVAVLAAVLHEAEAAWGAVSRLSEAELGALCDQYGPLVPFAVGGGLREAASRAAARRGAEARPPLGHCGGGAEAAAPQRFEGMFRREANQRDVIACVLYAYGATHPPRPDDQWWCNSYAADRYDDVGPAEGPHRPPLAL